jgi:hypothetical protein
MPARVVRRRRAAPQRRRQPAQAPVLRACACAARPARGDERLWGTDPYVGVIREAAAAVPVVTYALYNRDADVHVERLRLNMEETQARARGACAPLRGGAAAAAGHEWNHEEGMQRLWCESEVELSMASVAGLTRVRVCQAHCPVSVLL